MRTFDTARLIRLAAAGTLAGLLVFAIFDPSLVREERAQGMGGLDELAGRLVEMMLDTILLGACFSLITGALLVMADELGSPLRRVATKAGLAAAVGAGAGAAAGLLAQIAFGIFGVIAGLSAIVLGPLAIVILVIGRAIAWAMMGGGAGMGIGYALGSGQRCKMSGIGGAIGGFAGGFLFDIIAFQTEGGSLSRFVGFIVMGAAIGAGVALIEDVAKKCWITILSGAREGRAYILTKPTTTIGRDELADIPLFGDTNVGKQHALIRLADKGATVEALVGQTVEVNGAPLANAQLKDNDHIRIGRFGLRFSQKGVPAHAPAQPAAYSQSSPSPYQPAQQVSAGPATGTLRLAVIEGPYVGHSGTFGPGIVTIGREAGLQISLEHDTMISRRHAEIAWDGSAWWVRDLGSTNGTYINGTPITRQILLAGCHLKVGQTVMRVDSV